MKNSQIHLKGSKEPVEVTYQQAIKITDIFFDEKIRGDFVISVDDNSFRKSEIRYVRKIYDKPEGSKVHWIIVNHSRNCIWKQPYDSFEEAEKELKFQISNLSPGQKHSFAIEKRGGDASVVVSTSEKIDPDFKDFDLQLDPLTGL